MSDHPTPGKRVDYVAAQNKLLPKIKYTEAEPQNLPKMKQIVASLPPPPKQPAQTAQAAAGQGQGSGQPGQPVGSGEVKPSGKFKSAQGSDFTINYPDNWEVFGDASAGSLTIAPRAGLIQNTKGGADIAYGMMTAHYFPQDKKPNLQRDTNDLVKQIIGGNPGMQQTQQAKSVKVAGMTGLLTPLSSSSPVQGQKENDLLLTVTRPESIFYIMFVAPQSDWSATQPAFDNAVNSLRFTK
jgi:hypothetical protein